MFVSFSPVSPVSRVSRVSGVGGGGSSRDHRTARALAVSLVDGVRFQYGVDGVVPLSAAVVLADAVAFAGVLAAGDDEGTPGCDLYARWLASPQQRAMLMYHLTEVVRSGQ